MNLMKTCPFVKFFHHLKNLGTKNYFWFIEQMVLSICVLIIRLATLYRLLAYQ